LTQTRPDSLFTKRAVSSDPAEGNAGYLNTIDAAGRARGQARTAGQLSDTSLFQAARRRSTRAPIEYSRVRKDLPCRRGAAFGASADAPDTEFISVRTSYRFRAPMNRSLDWGRVAGRDPGSASGWSGRPSCYSIFTLK